ncbi:hypothetical protein PS2_013673 [Malus domestica]
MVTFLLSLSASSGSGSSTIRNLGGWMTSGCFWALDRRKTKTTTQPMRTAMEVVKIMTNSRFLRMTEVT